MVATLLEKISLKKTDLHQVVNAIVNKPNSVNSMRMAITERELVELINPKVKWLYNSRDGINSHKQFEETESYYRLLLDALVESGDLELGVMWYEIKPKLFLTYQRMQTEEKRHKQILWVSICSAFATALATYASFRH